MHLRTGIHILHSTNRPIKFKLHINIPFVDDLEQMPNYAKFMKDIPSRKIRLSNFETMNLIEVCSAIL